MQLSTAARNLGSRIAGIVRTIPEIMVPGTCLVCEKHVREQGGCCPQFWSRLRFISRPYCPVMGTPFSIDMGSGLLSAEAIAEPPPFDRLRAVMLYDDVARKLVASVKYSDRTDLVPWIANWMAVAGAELVEHADMIIPVPLHPSRLHARRFNQAGEMARHVCRSAGKPFQPECLIRKRRTKQQVGLSERARARNVSGAFVVPEQKKADVKGKAVLLVDDVYTTGATSKAAARALKRGGASQVDVLVFAKVETVAT